MAGMKESRRTHDTGGDMGSRTTFTDVEQQDACAIELIKKRDGKVVSFDRTKIADAIFKAAQAVGGEDRQIADHVAVAVSLFLHKKFSGVIPTVEDVQDAVEKVLVEMGHAKTALAYARYRDKRTRIRRLKGGDVAEVVDEIMTARHEMRDTTDLSLFVRTSEEDLSGWDRQRIVDALVLETGLDRGVANAISLEVEQQIIASKIKVVTAPLIRELVDAKLIEYGLEEFRRKHTRLGAPLFDVDKMIAVPNKENANIPHNPEATNLMLAERIKKEYALLSVFSQDIADAHICGDIHLHDLGFIDRPYCSGQSLEYVKKFGLDLPNALSIAKPAKHPETLLAHMVKFSAALQGQFAGAIGWDAVNIFFAPFLEGMSDRDMHQLAQMLIFEYSQQAVARGGQAIFSDINLYWEIPKHFEGVEAIGPGGQPTGRTYSDYLETSQQFLWAMFDVYREGDGTGRPFFFPKPLVHITEKFFETPGHQEFLNHICDIAAEKGNTYYVFDRGQTAKISECCRLSFKLEASDLEDAKSPWRMRYSALQNVTLNLPRAAYAADGDDEKLFEKLDELMETSAKAHRQKREFIEKLLRLGPKGPLSLLSMKRDGRPYLRMNRVTYLIGLLGMNELVQAHTGKQLHESEEAFDLGLKVTAHLNLACRKLSMKEGMRFVLEQTPAESTCYRLAKLDMKHFPDRAAEVVKGEQSDKGDVYYTNSTQFHVGDIVNPIVRVHREGQFHDMIEAGALTHVWLADARPSAESIANFVKKAFYQTRNAQIAFSPEFTSCRSCSRVDRGLSETCSYCGSTEVDGITRVTGYFSLVSGWNAGKIAELHDRATWNVSSVIPPAFEAASSNGDGIQIFGISKNVLHPDGCARCEQAKRIIGQELGRSYTFWDIDSPTGLMALSKYDLNGIAERHLPIIRIGDETFEVLGKAVKYLKKNGHGLVSEPAGAGAAQTSQ